MNSVARVVRAMVLASAMSSLTACATGFWSGDSTGSQTANVVPFNGYNPFAGQRLTLCYRNAADTAWILGPSVFSATEPAYTDETGQNWYLYDGGNFAIPTSGTAAGWFRLQDTDSSTNHVEVTRIKHVNGTRNCGNAQMRTFDIAQYDGACQANVGMAAYQSCGQDKDTLVYKDVDCPSPYAQLGTTKTRYDLSEMPSCARRHVAGLIAKEINRTVVASHYQIHHPRTTQVPVTMGSEISNLNLTCPGTNPAMTCTWGGFFQGHTNYLADMELRLRKYNEPWLPNGRLPFWRSNSSIPSEFRFVTRPTASGQTGCTDSRTTQSGCSGWNTAAPSWGATLPAAPSAIRTSAGLPSNAICNMTADTLYNWIEGSSGGSWHGSVHTGLGGSFATFDSPGSPLFFAWHSYIETFYSKWRLRTGC